MKKDYCGKRNWNSGMDQVVKKKVPNTNTNPHVLLDIAKEVDLNMDYDDQVGMWKIYNHEIINPLKVIKDVTQLLPCHYKYGAKRVCEFFMFCLERQRIWYKKKSNMPRPWTKDELLHSKHFCNLFREFDKGTQYLHRHIVTLYKEYSTSNNNNRKESPKHKTGGTKRKRSEISSSWIINRSTRLIKGCDFEGKVVDIPSDDNPYYRILYVDGDEEDMTQEEVFSYHKYYWKEEDDHHHNHHHNNEDVHDGTIHKKKTHETRPIPIGTIIVKRFDLEAQVIHLDRKRLLHTIQFDVNGIQEQVSEEDLKDMVLAYESKYEVTSHQHSTKENFKSDITFFSEVIFMVVCFRLINRMETFEMLGGIPRIKDWKVFVRKLKKLKKRNKCKIFTCAHQVIGFRRFMNTMEYLSRKDFTGLSKLKCDLQVPIKNKDLKGVTKVFRRIENIGPFFAWQITCDLLQSNILGDCDEDSFSLFGPGAKNGFRYIFPDLNHKCDEIDICKFLVQNQDILFECLQLDFKSVVGERRLTLKVMEHALCEFYKYNVSLRNVISSQPMTLRNYNHESPSKCQPKFCNTCGVPLPDEVGDFHFTSMRYHTVHTMICIDCYGFLKSHHKIL